MKIIKLLILSACCVAVPTCITSCGSTITIGDDGTLTVQPPVRPIVIPMK